jgi:hypothetical protein
VNGTELSGGDDGALVFVVVQAEALCTLHRTGSTSAHSLGFEGGCAAATVDDESEGRGGEVRLPGLDRVFFERRGRHVETNSILALTTRAATTRHPDLAPTLYQSKWNQVAVTHLAGFHLCIFEKDTDDKGDIVRIRDPVVVFMDKFEDFAVGDEFIEKGGDELGARETV